MGAVNASERADREDVLGFWFGGFDLDAAPAECRRRWFTATSADDAEIRTRFADLHARAAAGELRDWEQSARGRLALIVMFDQFSRHLHRGTSQAFAFDPHAQRLCREGIARGQDVELPLLGRAFFYMPLHHAEDAEAQALSVECFQRLAAAAPPALVEVLHGFAEYAVEHAEIVRRFGRFPHRNAILGRTSTPEEVAYLARGGATYGQAAP